jgi:alpha-tubulin suppressor-like RCC1 family protein
MRLGASIFTFAPHHYGTANMYPRARAPQQFRRTATCRGLAPVARILTSLLALILISATARAAAVTATWNYPTDIPITSGSYIAAGNTIAFTLNCVPSSNALTVIRNTGPAFIQGTFTNLTQGQPVTLTYSGTNYNFVANYHGGAGNDLVLSWAGSQAYAWGANTYGQLGNNSRSGSTSPVAVSTSGSSALTGKTVLALAAGASHTLALCSDGTIAAWGFNYDGELGNGTTVQAGAPVAVSTGASVSALAGQSVIAVAAGAFHSLALCANGTVAAWGYNYDGELGNNSTAGSLVPVPVNTSAGVSALAGQTVTAVASGQYHNLALCANGAVAAWGYNSGGELGNNTTAGSLLPVPVDQSGALAGKTVVSIAAGAYHSLALCSDGTVVAWGQNSYGQLGINSTTGSILPVAVNTGTTSALYGKTVVAIAAGAYHSLALCSDGSIAAWGLNDNGQLGDNTTAQRLIPVAVNTSSGISALFGKTVVAIQSGQYHSVAQCTDGSVAVWGGNFNGQLGDNSTAQSNAPVTANSSALPSGERYVTATSGCNASHTLALAATAPAAVPIMAVEQPAGSSLTNGATVNYGSWIVGNPVPLTFTIRNKGTSTLTGLTITENGANTGDFVITSSPATSVAPGSTTTLTVIFTAAASGSRTAAIQIASNDPSKPSFTVNLSGTGTTTGAVSAVFNTPNSIPITTGSYTATGNTIAFTLNCVPPASGLMVIQNTGLNFINGQFSNLAQGQSVSLTYGGIIYNFVANYYGGNGRDLVLVCAGTRAFAWGANNVGQLGTGNTNTSSVPAPMYAAIGSALFGKTVVSVAPGAAWSLILCSDGTVYACGDNSNGELGNNSTTSSLVPVPVDTGTDSALHGKMVVAIAAGQFQSVALCSDGSVATWGSNDAGDLGDNSSASLSLVPVPVYTGTGSALYGKKVVALSASYYNCLALCTDGTVVTWGAGALGNNPATGPVYIPIAVDMGPDSALFAKTVVSIASSNAFSLALCSDGTVAAWGENANGELGNNSTANSQVPSTVDSGTESALHGKTVVAIAAGSLHGMALCSDGTLVAWGENTESYGQLGDNGAEAQSLVPIAVDNTSGSALYGKTVTNIASVDFDSVALCSDGSIAAWGLNGSGQLGNPISGNVYIPTSVNTAPLASGELFTGLPVSDATAYHTLALVSWPGAPLATTLLATGITTTTATLNGSVNPNGNTPPVTFEYGTTSAYGNTVTAAPATISGTNPTAVATTITGLIPGTLYHYRVDAASVDGADQTFTAAQSSNPNLANLIISEGVLSPAFSGTTTQYTVAVTSQASSMTITPTVADYGSVTVNGTPIQSGSTTNPIPLAAGTNVITIVGTSQDGTASKAYTLTVIRPVETHTLSATFNSPTDVPATTSAYTATGSTINLTLNCVPLTGQLTVLKNKGPNVIQGQFSNLAQGQAVTLTYAGVPYTFVANYYGGTGRDLVLVWAGTRVEAWGQNIYGQLGINSTNQSNVPVNTVNTGALAGKTIFSLSTSYYFSVALCSDGTVCAWGYNNDGELGNNNTTASLVPVAVSTGSGTALYGKTVVSIANGFGHTLALCSDGKLVAWGFNGNGQLGTGGTTSSAVPVAVNIGPSSALYGKKVVAIGAGYFSSLALCSDGTVAAWGYNTEEELGNGGTAASNLPVPVDMTSDSALFGKTVVSISEGTGHCLALCSDGSIAAWGENANGQLGSNDTSAAQSHIPELVVSSEGSTLFGKTVVAVTAGNGHSLALCSDGTLAAWGGNYYGELGNNSTTDSPVPVAVNNAPGSALFNETVVAMAAGAGHSLALCSDGNLAAWGNYYNGALGNNGSSNSPIPVSVLRSGLAPTERFSGTPAAYYDSLALVSPSVKPPAPTCISSSATNISLSGAQLNGVINANGYDTTVAFEYGTDGVTFPNQINVTPLGLNGTNNLSLSTSLTGLIQGTTYYYLLTGTNVGGVAVSSTASFTTLAPPTASLGNAAAINTTSTLVTGTVNALGSSTQATFYYGTNPANLTNSIQATPSVATGYGNTPVSAVLSNLVQGTTYYYQVQASSVAGTGTSSIGSFQVTLLSGLTQSFPSAPLPSQGYLLVSLSPSNFTNTTLLPGWRFVGEQQWRQSNSVVTGLTTGNYNIEYEPIPGYIQPLSETVSIISGGAATVLNRTYYVDAGSESGAITVTLEPNSLVTSGSAQWEFVGESGAQWRNSGVTVSSLPAGNYLIECQPVTGYATPAPTAVTVQSGVTASASITYYVPDATVGTLPTVVPYQTVITGTGLPYAYVGQIQSDAGSATGFVVASRVVATAAHVVFNDATLSPTTGLQWLFQEYAGTYQPTPLTPRGYYDFAGYAAQRAAENTPGQSSPASQNLDAAALYFLQDAGAGITGTGGYSGYLASDSTDNEFLESNNLKLLVGYPVNNIPVANQGQLFATTPANITFTRVPGITASGTSVGVSSSNYRIYTTTGITSTGGNSGGPLCIQYNNGAYYPAAIYLGGSQETVVRAIDGDVVNMFNLAETSGNGGGNQNSGGITQTNSPIKGAQVQGANIMVTLKPDAAVSAGAKWTLIGDSSTYPSGKLLTGLSPATYTLHLSTVAGFDVPSDQSVTLTSGQQSNITYTYLDTSPPAITSALTLTATGGQPLTYQITASHSPKSLAATTLPPGLTITATSGLITGSPLTIGTFTIP